MSSFGEKVREAREAKGLSHQALADAAKLARNTVSRWENEPDRIPTDAPETFVRIAQALGTTVEGLVGHAPLWPGENPEFAAGARLAAMRIRALADELETIDGQPRPAVTKPDELRGASTPAADQPEAKPAARRRGRK